MPGIREFQEAATGLTEKAIGLTKETIGTLLNRDDLRNAGQAQQEKATERLEATRREMQADVERGKAQAKEVQQGRYQGKSDRDLDNEFDRSGPEQAGGAVGEKVKGGLKQAAGSLTGNDRLRDEGAVQQDKADAKARAAKEEAKAEEHRGKARAAEQEQKAYDR